MLSTISILEGSATKFNTKLSEGINRNNEPIFNGARLIFCKQAKILFTACFSALG